MNGTSHQVDPGVTLGQALATFHAKPKAGRLLDVEGGVLKRNAYPGTVLLNGSATSQLSTPLIAGDRIRTVAGQDRTEPTYQVKTTLSGEQPRNPQYYLGSAPGVQVTTYGKVSGKIASVVFDPTGKGHIPKAVALTFDDGPNPTYTPKILAILHRFHIKATFFLIGYEAQKYPSLVKKEQAAGMTIGDHSWSHPISPALAALPPIQIQAQIQKASDYLGSLGATPYLFRPPGGSYDQTVVQDALRLGMRTIIWTVDPKDWTPGIKAKTIVKRVLSNVHAGSIVLMHDGGGDRSATVRALPEIIKGIRKMGLKLVTIPRGA
jgi:peptidoglycan/xylan/chitin deacetylase (PgdA/CDA1 family)